MNKLTEKLYAEIKAEFKPGCGSDVRNYCNGIDRAIDIAQSMIDAGEVVVLPFVFVIGQTQYTLGKDEEGGFTLASRIRKEE